ncbi:integral membrane protein [Theileria orientalis strain Shintoku]|uniref:Integral membrane protein n=1 Tax=Theileria orientalis strain Shintoku TaxID=869250 RepID=J4D6Y3_THEOR|nr:integral membrane protein [Theileria orientalis strain Shintoku]BAM39820.1 integral membrane protein [Theileria orientalis strain Shintoku]|eukprot:XP_009690121.1 integral membrane protein [Theileria orientalis strain Shintoku]
MLKSHLISAGLSFSNYIQGAILEEPRSDFTTQDRLDGKKDEPQDNKPPNLLKSIFDLGRPYFRLDCSELNNNIKCLVVPFKKVRQLVPDLYIPSVSASTFMIASSVLLCIKSKGKLTFGDALSKTLTKFVLVNLSEICFLSCLLYFISYSGTPQTNEVNVQHFNPQPSPMELNQAYGSFNNYSQAFPTPVGFQAATNSQNFGKQPANTHMNANRTQTNDRIRFRLPDVLFVIGYKYVLVNYFLFITTVLPFSINTVVNMVYVAVCSLFFSMRSIKSLRSLQSNRSSPLLFIFPVFQPLFFYILLPSRKF